MIAFYCNMVYYRTMTCGVYLITCTANGKLYVGSAKDIRYRWSAHKSDFRNGNHVNKEFQNCWNKYGPEAFEISLLEETDPDIRITKEIEWFNKINPELNAMKPDPAAQR